VEKSRRASLVAALSATATPAASTTTPARRCGWRSPWRPRRSWPPRRAPAHPPRVRRARSRRARPRRPAGHARPALWSRPAARPGSRPRTR
jgi:hypothetical protein